MRSVLAVNDRVIVDGTTRTGTVTAAEYTVRLDDKPDVPLVTTGTNVTRIVSLDSSEFTDEVHEQVAAADAAIARARAMLAAAPDADRRELLADLGSLAGDLSDLVPGISGEVAKKIAAVATKLALLVEREVSR